MTTLKRNSRQLRDILTRIVAVKSFTLDNGFRGRDCAAIGDYGPREPWGWLRRDLDRFSPRLRLTERRDGAPILEVHYHGNHWLEVVYGPGHGDAI